jgi:hypothetical protein
MRLALDTPSFFLLSAPGFNQTPKAALDAEGRKASEIPHFSLRKKGCLSVFVFSGQNGRLES